MYWPCVDKGFQVGRFGSCRASFAKSTAPVSAMSKKRILALPRATLAELLDNGHFSWLQIEFWGRTCGREAAAAGKAAYAAPSASVDEVGRHRLIEPTRPRASGPAPSCARRGLGWRVVTRAHSARSGLCAQAPTPCSATPDNVTFDEIGDTIRSPPRTIKPDVAGRTDQYAITPEGNTVADVFISYSRGQRERVKVIADKLSA